MKKQGNNKTLVLIGLLLGLVFSELDQTVVSTALPTIIRDLHGMTLYGWVAGIYMLSITMFMPIFGKLADIYGRKKIYLSCVALFMVGSIISGLADSMTILLIGRGVQGIGAGGLMPLAMIIIGDTFPLEQRAKVQSLVGPLLILPQLIGPTIGGYFVSYVSWHWIFLINIPIGLIAAFIVSKGLREAVNTEKKSIDWAGAFTLVLAMLSLLLAPVLIDIKGYTWSSPVIIGLLTLFAVSYRAFYPNRVEGQGTDHSACSLQKSIHRCFVLYRFPDHAWHHGRHVGIPVFRSECHGYVTHCVRLLDACFHGRSHSCEYSLR